MQCGHIFIWHNVQFLSAVFSSYQAPAYFLTKVNQESILSSVSYIFVQQAVLPANIDFGRRPTEPTAQGQVTCIYADLVLYTFSIGFTMGDSAQSISFGMHIATRDCICCISHFCVRILVLSAYSLYQSFTVLWSALCLSCIKKWMYTSYQAIFEVFDIWHWLIIHNFMNLQYIKILTLQLHVIFIDTHSGPCILKRATNSATKMWS